MSSSEAEFDDEQGGEPDDESNDEDQKAPPADGSGRRAKRRISYAEQDGDDGEGEDDDNDYEEPKDGNDDHDEQQEDDEDEDSDDDIPLSALVEKKSAAAKQNGKKKKETAPSSPKKKKTKKESNGGTKKAAAAKKKPPPSSAGSSTRTYDYASAAMYQSECDKGLLIQRLLCRWWYAYDWPGTDLQEPPAHYETMDGFPGLFVCTSGDEVGRILDTRDQDTRPCFANFAKKPAAELKELLLKAIDGQLAVLENETFAHDTTSEQKQLKTMRKWANKVNATKADKEATKVLKTSKLKLT